MLNNFIGGGQVFLHKVRMFRQVLRTTVFVSVGPVLRTRLFGTLVLKFVNIRHIL